MNFLKYKKEWEHAAVQQLSTTVVPDALFPPPPFESQDYPWRMGFFKFRVGTCEGLYRYNPIIHAFEILAVVNNQKGNGHFAQAMKYFETSAIREGARIRLCEVFNPWLYYVSVRKHGYTRVKGTLFTLEKKFV